MDPEERLNRDSLKRMLVKLIDELSDKLPIEPRCPNIALLTAKALEENDLERERVLPFVHRQDRAGGY